MKVNKKSNLAVFDLDGTLFDTRTVNFLAYQEAIREEGYSLDREFYESQCNGKYYKDYLPIIIKNPSSDLMERIHIRKKILYPKYLSHCVVNEQLFNLIKLMCNSYHIALVTTASKANCMDILNYFRKTHFFELIISQEDVALVKPDPEGFIKTMSYFEVTPKQTIIFEDSQTGIEAAQKAGTVIFKVERF